METIICEINTLLLLQKIKHVVNIVVKYQHSVLVYKVEILEKEIKIQK